ncbi:hypothetical protein C798_12055 [Herbaspirillum rubrisubalbicans Os34]|uniref:Uncharacterized protein n=1 Tax=Herbaspirillum rubrisubalbicans Os34 TaxID=1235827 RepID=A0A6M3ZQR3_9BURK|nr:hypothetical protein C798_12055 [Herbaspirillum rubrisubalbicans Os34]
MLTLGAIVSLIKVYTGDPILLHRLPSGPMSIVTLHFLLVHQVSIVGKRHGLLDKLLQGRMLSHALTSSVYVFPI